MLCLCCSIGQSPDATSAAFGLKCAHTHTRVFSLSLSLSRSDAQRTRTHTTPCTRLTQTRNAHAHAHAHCPLHKAHSDSQRTRTHITPCTRLTQTRNAHARTLPPAQGLHGTVKTNPHGNIPVNETKTGTFLSNTRGTASIAHW
jgi:hypothetical protein